MHHGPGACDTERNRRKSCVVLRLADVAESMVEGMLPEGVTPTINRNFVIANIAAPSGLRCTDNEETA